MKEVLRERLQRFMVLSAFVCICLSSQSCSDDEADDAQGPNPELAAKSQLYSFLEIPRLYTWVELIGEDPSNNIGGMWVQIVQGKVYSLSWSEPDPDTDQHEWPAVAGRGVLENGQMKLAWRNATGNPEHAFYHATSLGIISEKGKAINGTFLQQETPDDTELGEGDFEATLHDQAVMSKRAEKMLSQFTYIIEQSQKSDDMCPVLPTHKGIPGINQDYQGQTYTFCCPSCKTLFNENPDAFVK